MQEVAALADTDAPFKAALARGQQPAIDPRIRAVYAIAPALVTLLDKQSLSALQVPVRIALAEQDEQIPMAATTKIIGRDLPSAEIISVPHAGHYAFLAPCSLRGKLFVGVLCSDSKRIDRSEVHRRVGRDAAHFFKAHLQP